MLKDALQKHDIEPAIELAPHFAEVRNTPKTHRLEQGNDRGRFAAASPDKSMIIECARACFQVDHDSASDSAPVPFVMDVYREFGGALVRTPAPEYLQRAPADNLAVNLRYGDGMSRRAVFEPREPLNQGERLGVKRGRGPDDVMILDVIDDPGVVAGCKAD